MNKEIKKFYISLIDNTDASWCGNFGNLVCKLNNIRITTEDTIIEFSYLDDFGYTIQTERIESKEIGISNFRMFFPYFGITARILRRIKKEKNETEIKLNNITNIISKDKVFNRDNKINQILN